MQLDRDSVFLAVSVLGLGLILFTWALTFAGRTTRFFWELAVGNTLLVVGLAIQVTQGTLSPWISVIFNNACLVGGLFFVVSFADRLNDQSIPRWPLFSAYGVIMVAWIFFRFAVDSFQGRSTLLALATWIAFGLMLVIVQRLQKSDPHQPLAILGLLLAAFFIIAVAATASAAVAVTNNIVNTRDPRSATVWAAMLLAVSMLVWSVCLVSLVMFRDQSRLKATLSTRDRMMALIAHDLRGPVGSVPVMLTMAKDPNLDEFDRNQLIEASIQTANDSVVLMENLLDWALAQQVKANLSPETLKVTSVVASAIQPLEAVARNKRIALEVACEPLEFTSDLRTVTTVIRNLTSNALKFTPNNGRVSMTASRGKDGIQIEIRDSGPGIPATVLVQLNKNLTVTSTHGTAGERGTGLGLSLCRDFTRANGGTLKFDASSTGTVATLTFPV